MDFYRFPMVMIILHLIFEEKLLILIYAYCFNVWLNDKSGEQSKTMSELDRLLGIAEKFSR